MEGGRGEGEGEGGDRGVSELVDGRASMTAPSGRGGPAAPTCGVKHDGPRIRFYHQ